MKLSSITLTTAALAAIAGSAIAAPCPLRARGLEEVNSFERDLVIYRRKPGIAVLKRDVDEEPVLTRRREPPPKFAKVNAEARDARARRGKDARERVIARQGDAARTTRAARREVRANVREMHALYSDLDIIT